MKKVIVFILMGFMILSCRQESKKQSDTQSNQNRILNSQDSIIIDCDYSFDEAIQGTKAPQEIVAQLALIDVLYYSMDNKLHKGQILCNKAIADDLKAVFEVIRKERFPVAKVIPVVKYNCDDELSMQANNSYSFCYRNISYSKHATGMAMDINPMQNPLRWKPQYAHRKDKPENAVYNPETPGTFYPDQAIVVKFKEHGFLWGRYFKRNFDDHHFEKKVLD